MAIGGKSGGEIASITGSNVSAFGDFTGETLTASVSGSASAVAGISLNWVEEI